MFCRGRRLTFLRENILGSGRSSRPRFQSGHQQNDIGENQMQILSTSIRRLKDFMEVSIYVPILDSLNRTQYLHISSSTVTLFFITVG